MKRKSLEEKVLDLGEYIVNTGSTVREAAAHFGIPKSTVHYDVTKILPKIDPILYDDVLGVLDINLKDRVRRAICSKKRRKDNVL